MKSIVSYPERGQGGKSSYRGNCSPKLISDLIEQFKLEEINDYACGSGTTKDVAEQLGIRSFATDLRLGFDLMNHEIDQRPEAIFFHPPYWDIIRYADSMYSAQEVKKAYGYDPLKSDLSQIPTWEGFVNAMNYCVMKQFNALAKGGRMFILMGDIKKKGKLYSMLCDIMKPGTLEQIVIKAQHNCWSDQVSYSGRFIPIVHEYLLIVRKDLSLSFLVKVTKNIKADIRSMKNATWKDIVAAVLEDAGSPLCLDQIYNKVKGFERAKDYKIVEEKVRQTLQRYPSLFKSVSRGIWGISTCAA